MNTFMTRTSHTHGGTAQFCIGFLGHLYNRIIVIHLLYYFALGFIIVNFTVVFLFHNVSAEKIRWFCCSSSTSLMIVRSWRTDPSPNVQIYRELLLVRVCCNVMVIVVLE